jgi:CHRD domain
MRTATRFLVPLAAAAVGVMAGPALYASADSGNTTYQATLSPLNHASGSGTLTLTMNGNQATISEHWSGLAPSFSGAPYPHVQHIHGAAQGTCPSMGADKNGDGVISTTEGAPSYGGIVTTLSTSGDTSPAAATDLKVAPAGGSTDYSRTVTLSGKAMQAITGGTAVVVVHGLDPATLSKKAQGEKSDLVPSLPLAATSPALCGALVSMPGAPQTGNGSTAGTEDLGMFGLGGSLLALAAGGVLVANRRKSVTEVQK